MKTGSRLSACLLSGGLVAGCAEMDKRVEAPPPPKVVEEAPPVIVDKAQSQPLKYLVGRDLKPMPTRPLNVRSRCAYRDDIGTRTRLSLLVKNAQVRTFVASVNMPKHGTCRFNLRNFRQTASLPQAQLTARDGSDCTVRLWEQGDRVTVAFNNCSQSCDGEAFNYLWPIMVEAKSGRCF
ncbi:MAG: hypothetical protein H6R10_1764 [Rhodocyclaceae bacterium]|nr:hypothetical protein [Rhodocyclaceae bacterium]